MAQFQSWIELNTLLRSIVTLQTEHLKWISLFISYFINCASHWTLSFENVFHLGPDLIWAWKSGPFNG